ncbi:MAG: hypothetical protein KAX38_02075, partial [Candidatus Krumholzibacteria bacterium]|nr:hypothetical protein [Candidatus Krumholzibacteria bacterium]
MLSFTDHFGISEETIKEVLLEALSKGGSYSDLYFEHTFRNQITLEEEIVKEGVKWISCGVGIRVLKGESTGYAYTEDLSMDKMKKAARTAAAIADS